MICDLDGSSIHSPLVSLFPNQFGAALNLFCSSFYLLQYVGLIFCSRFVLNVPKEDLQSFERILFLIEYAHWFYEDNSVERNPSLKSLNLKEFTSLRILHSCETN